MRKSAKETTNDLNKNFEIGKDDQKKLRSKLKKSFPVNDELLRCTECHSKTFVQCFEMNSHLLSCIKDQKSDGGLTPVFKDEHKDADGIYCHLSVPVKKMEKQKETKKGQRQQLSCASW